MIARTFDKSTVWLNICKHKIVNSGECSSPASLHFQLKIFAVKKSGMSCPFIMICQCCVVAYVMMNIAQTAYASFDDDRSYFRNHCKQFPWRVHQASRYGADVLANVGPFSSLSSFTVSHTFQWAYHCYATRHSISIDRKPCATSPHRPVFISIRHHHASFIRNSELKAMMCPMWMDANDNNDDSNTGSVYVSDKERKPVTESGTEWKENKCQATLNPSECTSFQLLP